jgi:hypothetical protein
MHHAFSRTIFMENNMALEKGQRSRLIVHALAWCTLATCLDVLSYSE